MNLAELEEHLKLDVVARNAPGARPARRSWCRAD